MDAEATPTSNRSGTIDAEVDEWAKRERQHREAWLEGPSDAEKREWMRRQRRSRSTVGAPAALGPTEEEVDEWAERESRRRRAWLEGPSQGERDAWASHEARRQRSSYDDPFYDAAIDDDWYSEPDRATMSRVRRDLYLARLGVLSRLLDFPVSARASLIEAGRVWEEDFARPVRRRRISIDD